MIHPNYIIIKLLLILIIQLMFYLIFLNVYVNHAYKQQMIRKIHVLVLVNMFILNDRIIKVK